MVAFLEGHLARFRLGSEFEPSDMASDGGTCGEFGAVVARPEVAGRMGPSVAVFHWLALLIARHAAA